MIIFLLVVFVLGPVLSESDAPGQGHQAREPRGGDRQLTEQLDLEEATTAELRLSVSQLSSDLQSALADRDDTAALLAETEAERDEFRNQLFLLQDEKALLTQTLNELRAEAARSGELEAELERTTDLRARLEAELQQAQQTVATDKETLEAQLAQLIQLRRDIEALQSTRNELELQVAEMSGAAPGGRDSRRAPRPRRSRGSPICSRRRRSRPTRSRARSSSSTSSVTEAGPGDPGSGEPGHAPDPAAAERARREERRRPARRSS